MTMLTALEYNYGLSAPTETCKKIAYSRAQKQYVLKNDNKRDTTNLKKNLMISIIESMNENGPLPMDLSSYIRKPIPSTFHRVEKPSKDDLTAVAMSRMTAIEKAGIST